MSIPLNYMGQLKLAKAKGTILAELKKIERVDLLILDDFGIQPFDPQSRVTGSCTKVVDLSINFRSSCIIFFRCTILSKPYFR